MAFMLVIAAVGGAVIWWLTGAVAPALQLVLRYVWFGMAAGGAVALCWLASGTECDRLLRKRRHTKGKNFGWLGFIVGLILAGFLAQRLPSDDTAAEPLHPKLGQAIEIAGPTLDGGRYDLAGQRGKVVLVDFWATWCGPCVAELPNVRAAYEKYHGDGLEVVAISLDNETSALAEFLKTNHEPWPQIIFVQEKERGFQNPLAQQFGIQAIPYLLVIDRDGKVAARDVRGQQIENSVMEALGLPVPWFQRLAAFGWRLMGWLFVGVLFSPVWLLFACVIGATALWLVAEKAVRRALRRSNTASGKRELAGNVV